MKDVYLGVTALVTGASKGLGREYALELTRRGARVILLARSQGDLQKLATRIRREHGESAAEVIVGDLAAADGPDRILRELRERGLTVDLLINNAGAGKGGPFLDRPLEPQLHSIALNINGLLALTHTLGAEMVARRSGGIINVASTAAFQPMPYVASYSASKTFVLAFTEALAEELRGTGVRVMAAHPGAIATSFFDGTSLPAGRKADTPATIAAQTLDDYARGRTASYPGGISNRAVPFLARLLTRNGTARFAAWYNRREHLHEVTDLPQPVQAN